MNRIKLSDIAKVSYVGKKPHVTFMNLSETQKRNFLSLISENGMSILETDLGLIFKSLREDLFPRFLVIDEEYEDLSETDVLEAIMRNGYLRRIKKCVEENQDSYETI